MTEQERAKASKSGVCLKCHTCKHEVWAFPYKAKRDRIFCSTVCRSEYTIPLFLKAAHESTKGRIMTDEEKLKRKTTARRGENSPMWKGAKVQYRALHDWVSSRLGKPHDCVMCGNTELRHRQYHWANVSGQYLRDLDDWMRLCATCHKRYDIEMKLLGITETAY